MLRPDLLIFGYSTVTVAENDRGAAMNLLLKNGIGAALNRNGEFIIPWRKKEKVKKLFSEKIDFIISEPIGVCPFLYAKRKRYGVILGVICFVFLLYLSSDTVWDVRIDGVDMRDEESVRADLAEAGLSVGKRWSKINRSQIEINALDISEHISWININRRGAVAYVKVRDKIVYQGEEVPFGSANIVASRDCVIEEINVKSGYPMVKKGESVKAGELLISGVIPTELGGGFCYASGVVIGRYNDSVEAFSENVAEQKEYSERTLIKWSVNIFGKEINIFKRYGQYGECCDIIEKKKDLRLFKRLPISFTGTYAVPYEIKTRELSADETARLCIERLRENMVKYLADKEVKRMITEGGFSPEGYRMICHMTLSSDVGKIQEFEVE